MRAISARRQQGFTLIELLIVIGIIGFLAAAVLVAVDPVRRIQESRDARRYAEVNAILNAVLTKQVDDRKVYNGADDARIITSQTNSQVIVTDATGIECDAASAGLVASYPGCKQVLDTAARVIGTVSSALAVVTGTGTNFVQDVRVGDTLVDAATGLSPCVVKNITSATVLNCVGTVSPAYTADPIVAYSKNCVVNLSDTFALVGTSTSSGVTVTGDSTSTNFTVQVAVGDVLTDADGNECVVDSITDADTLICETAPASDFAAEILYNTLENPLVPNYIAEIPLDPRGEGEDICSEPGECTTDAAGITTVGTNNTGYYLHRSNGNRIEIGACHPDDPQGDGIEVKVKR